jgi:hypothetical protein
MTAETPFRPGLPPTPSPEVRDIVGLYLSPPNRALVLSIDEKSQIQAPNREQPGTAALGVARV